MQPYIFPYIGYFQLIKATDKIIFYDDVNWIKKGWINRNRLLINGSASIFTIPCTNVSQNKLILDIELLKEDKHISKLLKSIDLAYKQAPHFNEFYPIVNKILNSNCNKISELAIYSIKEVFNYLNLELTYDLSSKKHFLSRGQIKEDRLIDICHKEQATTYINSIGGKELYNKEYFRNKGIELFFIDSKEIKYEQFTDDFISHLSIIDVLMFNSKDTVIDYLNNYELI